MDRNSPKLLLVTEDKISTAMAEYAFNVALRLDVELVVLFVDEQHAGLATADRQKALERFEAKIEAEAARFSAMAWEKGIPVTTIVDVDERESAIAQARQQDADIRFLLTDSLEWQDADTLRSRQGPCLKVLSGAS